ncbi:MAG: DNA gyrase inhibitor YacG [Burkholderiales bacterium]|nr:MAG: DNA gyrase inhibitor YacG [Burkholderiales bacterium]TAG82515.1 MAG: DNA gyrase inhibitor YacG [Betaproteobacteria bacterium]
MATRVKCPRCEAEVIWGPQSKWRPFCSERCKLMDLGAWANEEYRVAGQPGDPTLIEEDPRRS